MAYLGTADIAHFNKTDMDLVVSDILNGSPLLQAIAAITCKSNVFYYTRETTAPTAGFRNPNDGRTNAATTREKVTVTLGIMDASFAVDMAVAQSDERGWEHAMGEEAMSHLRQAMFEVECQILNGTGNDSDGFSGFADLTVVDATADPMVIDAGGTLEGSASSVYLIRSGPGDVEAVWGQEGEIAIGDMQIIERAGSVSGVFPAYYHPIVGWAGVKIGSSYSVARIANITTETNCTLTDDMISDAIAEFPVGREPTQIIMNRRSRKQLQQSRTATNATGAPAPIPMESFGVPIVTTDALLKTESLIGA